MQILAAPASGKSITVSEIANAALNVRAHLC
jgi:hypothetical protein